MLGDLYGPWRVYPTVREQATKAGRNLCDMYVIDYQDELVALCTDVSFKTLDRDFFSLLLGSAPARSQKLRTTASPKQVQPPTREAYSSDTSRSFVIDELLAVVKQLI